jgi:hypothetical protein
MFANKSAKKCPQFSPRGKTFHPKNSIKPKQQVVLLL